MSDEKRHPHIRRATEMEVPAAPQWLGIGWMLWAAVNVLVGDEGIGKSLFWVLVAMHITRGAPEPTLRMPHRAPGDVVVVATEDSWGEIHARLDAAGVDLERVHLFCDADDELGLPTFPEDEARFREWLDETGIRPSMIVVDAWLDTVPPGVTVKSPQGARAAIEPWKRIAKRSGAAVLLLAHTNRLDTTSIRNRIGSTAALRQVARVLLFADRHPDDGRDGGPSHLWVGPEKANGARIERAVRFELLIDQRRPATESDPGTVATLDHPQVQQERIADLVSDWAVQQQQMNRKPTVAEQAEAWLLRYMQGRQVAVSTDVQAAGKAEGFGESAMGKAMKAVGVSKPGASGGTWMFTLRSAETAETAESPVSVTARR